MTIADVHDSTLHAVKHLIRTLRRRWLLITVVAVLGSEFALVALVATHFVFVQTTVRWQLRGSEFAAAIDELPSPRDGMLKHVEWNSWGFTGASTVEYLVLDPDDALSTVTGHKAPISAPGIPCEVWQIRRVDNHYFVVTFYTEQEWGYCGAH